MKKILFLSIFTSISLFGKINTIVSIIPEKTFVKAIGGKEVNVDIMVLLGNSPHTYEPKPSQMKNISKADIYFSIGVEFENVWLERFKNLNKNMHVVDLSKKVNEKSKNDPHIWTSPKNVKTIIKYIYEALSNTDPENEKYYRENYENFLLKIEKLDAQIRESLSGMKKGAKFMVFHPSWGYFAKEYGLVQLAVETEGKSPKPKELIEIINIAKKEHISAIFTQPEFSDSVAKVMADELHIKVIKVSPLAKNWSENLIYIANAIAGKE
jgi:zinc transport system substrate-binding protein